MWANLGIRQKVFILLSIIALLPLIVISIIWVRSTHSQLQQSAVNRETILIGSITQRINDAVNNKVNDLITHSQETSVINLKADEAKVKLLQYANQDTDIQRIALIDNVGNEKVVISDHAISSTLTNVKASNAFKVVTQVSNDVSISDVTYVNGKPKIIIAVPLINFGKLGDQNLTNEQALVRRYGADIKGALVVDMSLESLWKTVLSSGQDSDGYTYLVDSSGKLIAHPDANILLSQSDQSKNQQVAKFLNRPESAASPSLTISEKNVNVLSAHAPIDRTGWAVITQVPVESIFAPANQVAKLALFIFVSSSIVSLLLSLLFSRNITRPIRSLVTGTSQLGQGNFDTYIPIHSNDEIGVLAARFNAMAKNLKQLISNLTTETTKMNVVLDSVGEGIIATDANNNIAIANISAAVLAGSLPNDVRDKPFSEIFPLYQNGRPFTLDHNGTKVYKDIAYTAPNKRTHYLDIFVNKIVSDPDDIKNIITFRDQTDERELEMMKLDFVSMAAHELRTPITAIRGYLRLLSVDDQSHLSEESQRSIKRAQSSTIQLVRLIGNLLNVSKIERGSLSMDYSKIDWPSTVKDALSDHEFSAKEKHIDLRYEGPESGIPIMADEIAIREVINNLIANAIHFTHANGTITVSVKQEDDMVYTYVKDNGIGISANALSHLFTKFYRVKGGIASGSGGTGLGLFISKSIVEMHNGTIWAKSEEGHGSTFGFRLPAYDEVQYESIVSSQTTGVNKRRGWFTKNTTR